VAASRVEQQQAYGQALASFGGWEASATLLLGPSTVCLVWVSILGEQQQSFLSRAAACLKCLFGYCKGEQQQSLFLSRAAACLSNALGEQQQSLI
jgi:hypothetical protein